MQFQCGNNTNPSIKVIYVKKTRTLLSYQVQDGPTTGGCAATKGCPAIMGRPATTGCLASVRFCSSATYFKYVLPSSEILCCLAWVAF
jgi:hypothetical protein